MTLSTVIFVVGQADGVGVMDGMAFDCGKKNGCMLPSPLGLAWQVLGRCRGRG